MFLGAGVAGAATGGGEWAIPEHQLTPQDEFKPGPDLTEGDITPTQVTDEENFVHKTLKEGNEFTRPFLGPSLTPTLRAGAVTAASHDRRTKAVGFAERIDLDLYLLQIQIPSFVASNGTSAPFTHVDFDLLLPWKLQEHHRVGLLLGSSLNTNGGVSGQRFQAMYGFGYKPVDVSVRAGYGLSPTATPSANGAPAQAFYDPTATVGPGSGEAAFLYGGTVGVGWADWGKVALELQGARTAVSRADEIRLLPGVRLYPSEGLEVGVAAIIDNFKAPNVSFDTRNIGGLVDLAYRFL